MAVPLVILDRDGVINADSPDHIRSPAEWRPLPGSLEAVARLNAADIQVALATNQSGIARGLFSEDDLAAIQRHMADRLAAVGGHIDLALHCPDGPESTSRMRKPGPGMLEEIARRLGTGLAGVPFVGDSRRDIQAARAAGALPVLVRTGNGEATLADGQDLAGVAVHADLAAFVDDWLEGSRPGEPRPGASWSGSPR